MSTVIVSHVVLELTGYEGRYPYFIPTIAGTDFLEMAAGTSS